MIKTARNINTRWLKRKGMPSRAVIMHSIQELGIEATALALRVNKTTLRRWYDAELVQAAELRGAGDLLAW